MPPPGTTLVGVSIVKGELAVVVQLARVPDSNSSKKIVAACVVAHRKEKRRMRIAVKEWFFINMFFSETVHDLESYSISFSRFSAAHKQLGSRVGSMNQFPVACQCNIYFSL